MNRADESTERGRRAPKFSKGEIVWWGPNPFQQIVKVSRDEEGNPIYKVKPYSSIVFFGKWWARESDLRPMVGDPR